MEIEVRGAEKNGAFLSLDLGGVTREFFVVAETTKYSSFSSSLVKAGERISYSATLEEIVEKRYDTYGTQIVTGPKKYQYFRGWVGLEHVVDFHELT